MPRVKVRPEIAVWMVAIYAATVLNIPFWRRLWAATEPATIAEWLFLAVVAIDVLLLMALFFGLFALPRIFHAVAALTLTTMAAASYYMLEYGTVFDREMIRNVFETDTAEASDLMSWRLAAMVIALAVIPIALLWRVEIDHRPLRDEVRIRAISAAILLAVAVAISLPFSSSFASIVRANGALRYEINPFNYVFGVVNYLRQSRRTKQLAKVPLPPSDAARAPAWQSRSEKTLLVVVIGETARAKNFSLLGYDRPTNPRLAAMPDVLTFSNTMSCGTFTAHSLPCMFTPLGREAFSIEAAKTVPSLVDTLKAAGFGMLWRNNNSGCKDVCNTIPTETVGGPQRQFYDGNLPFDEALLDNLDPWLDRISGPSVLFLHMRGSHGPAYYKRYPPAFDVFKPACQDTRFSKCSTESIVNAYDNTILYTDHVLAEFVGKLKSRAPGLATAMLYVSDHGESLGESRMYLHGAPYALAPMEQKHVPMIVWTSPEFQREARLDLACVRGTLAAPTSHDNFFHSIVGLLDVTTKSYQAPLDVFARCRK